MNGIARSWIICSLLACGSLWAGEEVGGPSSQRFFAFTQTSAQTRPDQSPLPPPCRGWDDGDENLSAVSLFDWTHRFTLDCVQIRNLPLRGRRTFDQLALLSNGVFRVPFSPGRGPAVGIGVGTAGQFSVNGMRGRSNGFTIDGSDNNDEDIGMRRQGFIALVPQTIDSIQDFQIQTAGFTAEFGRNAGSVVNAVSRSGTNRHHGSLYSGLGHDAFNAGGFFQHQFADTVNDAARNGGRFSGKDFQQRIFGGLLGGPLIPDRLFYFISAEHQRIGGSRLGHFVVPTEGERGLRVSTEEGVTEKVQSFGGFVPIDRLQEFLDEARPGFFDPFDPINYSAQAGQAIYRLYPLPNNPLGPFGDRTFSQVAEDSGEGAVFSAKLDWQVSNHSLTGRYNFTQDDSVLPFTGSAIDSSVATDTRTQNLSLYLNSVWNRSANVLRFSFGRTRLSFPAHLGSPLLLGAMDCGQAPDCLQASFGRFQIDPITGPLGQLSIEPYSTIGVDVFNFPQGRVNNTFQLADGFTRSFSDHLLQFGADIRFSQLNSFADRNSRPALVFGNGLVAPSCRDDPSCPFDTSDGLLRGTDLAALGAPAAVLHSIAASPAADTAIGLHLRQYAVFINDNWRLRPNLTINLGLRYELHSPPTEANRRIEDTFGLTPGEFGHLDPRDPQLAGLPVQAWNDAFDDALTALQGFVDGRRRIFEADRNNLAPRIGFAWDPFGKGRTSLRAGYGIYYDAQIGAVTSQSRNVFPTFVPVNLAPNLNPPTGRNISSANSLVFLAARTSDGTLCRDVLDDPPAECFLIQPGRLNSYNFSGDEFATGLGTLFLQTFNNAVSGNGLAFTLPERFLKSSYGQHFALSLQQQWGDYVASLNYVGTRGLHLLRFNTPNGGWTATPELIFPFTDPPPGFIGDFPEILIQSDPPRIPPGQQRPIDDLGAFTTFTSSASSSYHSLQAWLDKRLGASLQFRINWTWSHAIDEVSDPFDGRGFFAFPQDSRLLGLERGPANFDVRHRVSGYFHWRLPQSEWGAGLLKAWRLSGIAELQTGQPFTVNTAWDRNQDGNLTDRPDSLQGLILAPDSASGIRLDPSLAPFVSVAAGNDGRSETVGLDAVGQLGRNTFRSDGVANFDLSLARTFELAGEKALEFRVEAFNLFNHTSFGIPYRILDPRREAAGQAVQSPGFGQSFDTQTDARSFRFWLRLDF